MRLAREGASGITMVDLSNDGLAETSALVSAANPKCVTRLISADVANAADLERAFRAHVHEFGDLHACFNNAGIGERAKWHSVVDVNLNAVIQGTRLAVDAMRGKMGSAKTTASDRVVVNVASAGGIFPMPQAPVYSATKAAVVLYSQSLAHLHKMHGVRVNALCPQFTDTALVQGQFQAIGEVGAKALLAQTGGELLTVDQVVDAAMELVRDQTKAGAALAVMNRGDKNGGFVAYVPTPNPKFWKRVRTNSVEAESDAFARYPAPAPLPSTFRKVVVHMLSADFAAATKIVTAPMPRPAAGEVLIERRYTGVNASDVNFSAGRYFGGAKQAASKLPFDAGFESVGVVAAVGTGVQLRPGQPVATLTYGGFSEYAVERADLVMPVPEASARALVMLTSGLTASLALEMTGGIPLDDAVRGGSTKGKPKTVLVTAAAGGTGQIAVQLAKLAGHRVVATCGGDAKAKMLTDLGVDRVINYRKEKVRDVLRKEFKRGVDVVYESVGGEMFAAAMDALAPKGVCIIIGMMSQYTSGGSDANSAWVPSNHPGLPEKLLWKSASLRGFFLPQYAAHFKRHLQGLFRLMQKGQLRGEIDPTPFAGMEAVNDAVAHLQGGKSIGKVVVDVSSPGSSQRVQSKL